jgi:sec-independent protein translocase protein TatA
VVPGARASYSQRTERERRKRETVMPVSIGPMELVVVLVIALLVLGPKRLPEVGRSVGKGMREFKDSLSGINQDDDEEDVKPLRQPAKTAE